MSTFYLLPPRPFLADRLAAFLMAWFPGVECDRTAQAELIELAEAIVSRSPDVYVLHREDLPDGDDAFFALASGFGAEPGDEVVEVHAGARPGELTARRWRVAA